MSAKSRNSERPFTRRILVEGLFGRYNYDLGLTNQADSSRLLILYGDNGSGKTTFLSLVYYLLTTTSGQGYKSFVARTPYRAGSPLGRRGDRVWRAMRTSFDDRRELSSRDYGAGFT